MPSEDDCVCGKTYAEFRTGETFASVRQLLWVPSDDSSRWRHKRRHSVLGFWRELKLRMWAFHMQECQWYRDADGGR